MFDEVLRKQRSRRLVRRASFLAGSTALQVVAVALVALAISAMARSAPPEPPPSVEVKFVKGAPRVATPSSPPAPPRRQAVRAPRPAPEPAPAPVPAAPMVQPREIPDRIAAPEPPEPPVQAPAGGGGVLGGAAGGADGGGSIAATAPRPDFDAASMTRPTFVAGPDPAYTRAALSHQVEGTMVVACVVTRQGLVRECHVLQGLPYMDAAVVEALERRRYRPATLAGEPVEVTYQFRLSLRMPR